MDLLTQLKTLRDNTNSPEVKSICESNIQKIQKGENNLDTTMIMESIQNVQKETEPITDPHQMLREQELAKSKNVASKLMESWGGLGSSRSKNSGSYVEGAKEEKPPVHLSADKTTDYQRLTEVLSLLKQAGLTKIGFVTASI